MGCGVTSLIAASHRAPPDERSGEREARKERFAGGVGRSCSATAKKFIFDLVLQDKDNVLRLPCAVVHAVEPHFPSHETHRRSTCDVTCELPRDPGDHVVELVRGRREARHAVGFFELEAKHLHEIDRAVLCRLRGRGGDDRPRCRCLKPKPVTAHGLQVALPRPPAACKDGERGETQKFAQKDSGGMPPGTRGKGA
jgi:hypothetical protein